MTSNYNTITGHLRVEVSKGSVVGDHISGSS